MWYKYLYNLIRFLSALIWLINGLYCKLLHFVPRHEMIVRRILHTNHAMLFTNLIGMAEMVMFLWIISSYKSKWNAIVQMIVIAMMNLIEFLSVPDLLLWGRGNAIFAALFIIIIGINEFILKPKISATHVILS